MAFFMQVFLKSVCINNRKFNVERPPPKHWARHMEREKISTKLGQQKKTVVYRFVCIVELIS